MVVYAVLTVVVLWQIAWVKLILQFRRKSRSILRRRSLLDALVFQRNQVPQDQRIAINTLLRKFFVRYAILAISALLLIAIIIFIKAIAASDS